MYRKQSLSPFELAQLVVIVMALVWPPFTWRYSRVTALVSVHPVRVAPDFIARRTVLLPDITPPPPTSTARPVPTPVPSPTPSLDRLLRAPNAGQAVSLKQAPSFSQRSPAGSLAPSSLSSPSQAPTRLFIPAIDLEATIVVARSIDYEYQGQSATTWQVPNWFAVGWHENSAPPGEPGNTVLNGHRNIYGSVFRDLGELEIGDEIIVYADETDYHYHVVHQELVREAGQPLDVRAQNARLLLPTQDRRLTLVTCAPLTQSTHRLILVAQPLQMASPPSDAQ